jgi:hypothetical protein
MKTRTLTLIGFAALFAAALGMIVFAADLASVNLIIPGIDPHIIPGIDPHIIPGIDPHIIPGIDPHIIPGIDPH